MVRARFLRICSDLPSMSWHYSEENLPELAKARRGSLCLSRHSWRALCSANSDRTSLSLFRTSSRLGEQHRSDESNGSPPVGHGDFAYSRDLWGPHRFLHDWRPEWCEASKAFWQCPLGGSARLDVSLYFGVARDKRTLRALLSGTPRQSAARIRGG